MLHFACASLFCSLLLGAEWASAATTPLFTADPQAFVQQHPGSTDAFIEPNNNNTWGYSFYVTAPITVTHLGWLDWNRDGLAQSHPVGLWKDTTGLTKWPYIEGGELVASVVLPAGTAAELAGPWRRLPVGPITLAPGGYSLGGQHHEAGDPLVYMSTAVPYGFDPRVRVGAFTHNIHGPEGFYAPPGAMGWFLDLGVVAGPILFLEPVPEPSAAAIAILAFGIVLLAGSSGVRRSLPPMR